jgi:hypothetical protein
MGVSRVKAGRILFKLCVTPWIWGLARLDRSRGHRFGPSKGESFVQSAAHGRVTTKPTNANLNWLVYISTDEFKQPKGGFDDSNIS